MERGRSACEGGRVVVTVRSRQFVRIDSLRALESEEARRGRQQRRRMPGTILATVALLRCWLAKMQRRRRAPNQRMWQIAILILCAMLLLFGSPRRRSFPPGHRMRHRRNPNWNQRVLQHERAKSFDWWPNRRARQVRWSERRQNRPRHSWWHVQTRMRRPASILILVAVCVAFALISLQLFAPPTVAQQSVARESRKRKSRAQDQIRRHRMMHLQMHSQFETDRVQLQWLKEQTQYPETESVMRAAEAWRDEIALLAMLRPTSGHHLQLRQAAASVVAED